VEELREAEVGIELDAIPLRERVEVLPDEEPADGLVDDDDDDDDDEDEELGFDPENNGS
jgi:hypothetical protein